MKWKKLAGKTSHFSENINNKLSGARESRQCGMRHEYPVPGIVPIKLKIQIDCQSSNSDVRHKCSNSMTRTYRYFSVVTQTKKKREYQRCDDKCATCFDGFADDGLLFVVVRQLSTFPNSLSRFIGLSHHCAHNNFNRIYVVRDKFANDVRPLTPPFIHVQYSCSTKLNTQPTYD